MNTHEAQTTLAHELLRVNHHILNNAITDIEQTRIIPDTRVNQAITNAIIHLQRAQANPDSDFNVDIQLHSAALELQEAINLAPTTAIANALRSAYRVLDDIAATLDANLK